MRRQYTGLSMAPKRRTKSFSGRGASPGGRSRRATSGGPPGSENAGTSSESGARNPAAASPRFPGRCLSSQGQPGAKARPRGAADAQLADIPAPLPRRYDRRGDGEGQPGGVLDVPVKARRGVRMEISAPRPRDARRSLYGEAGHPMLPRKTPRQARARPYQDRHRWAGRTYRGDRENHGQGTRHTGPVT